MSEKRGIIDRIALKYIQEKAILNTEVSDEPHILNEQELKAIKKVKRQTIVYAALIGTLGVLALYLPQYFFPGLFPVTKVKLFGEEHSIELVSAVYGILLIWPELWALNVINLRAVRIMSSTCVYPRAGSADFDFHTNALTDAGLEKEHKGLQKFGLNPYLNMNKIWLYTVLIINRLKATLSNIVFKIVIKRILGRYAVRQVTDLAGIPIFAFWNAWASAKVLVEAKFRIMAPMALQYFVHQLKTEIDRETLKPLIFPALQYSIALKRKYNYAQFYFTNLLHAEFQFDTESTLSQEQFLLHMQTATEVEKQYISKLIICAVVTDGELSNREKRSIERLKWFTFSKEELIKIAADFHAGRGLGLS